MPCAVLAAHQASGFSRQVCSTPASNGFALQVHCKRTFEHLSCALLYTRVIVFQSSMQAMDLRPLHVASRIQPPSCFIKSGWFGLLLLGSKYSFHASQVLRDAREPDHKQLMLAKVHAASKTGCDAVRRVPKQCARSANDRQTPYFDCERNNAVNDAEKALAFTLASHCYTNGMLSTHMQWWS